MLTHATLMAVLFVSSGSAFTPGIVGNSDSFRRFFWTATGDRASLAKDERGLKRQLC